MKSLLMSLSFKIEKTYLIHYTKSLKTLLIVIFQFQTLKYLIKIIILSSISFRTCNLYWRRRFSIILWVFFRRSFDKNSWLLALREDKVTKCIERYWKSFCWLILPCNSIITSL